MVKRRKICSCNSENRSYSRQSKGGVKRVRAEMGGRSSHHHRLISRQLGVLPPSQWMKRTKKSPVGGDLRGIDIGRTPLGIEVNLAQGYRNGRKVGEKSTISAGVVAIMKRMCYPGVFVSGPASWGDRNQSRGC